MSVRVFVPLVNADGGAEQLFEAIASDIPPEPHPAKLIPQIAELFDFGLYRIGQAVREAVTRFVDQRRPRVWLGARNAAPAPWYLRISDLQVGRLSDDNARSAGLGLALAAMFQAFRRDPGIIFATGEIILPSGQMGRPVEVGPVGGIRAKLSLLGDYLVQHRSTLAGAGVLAVVPARTLDGEPMEGASADILRRIRQEAAAAGAKLDVVFAATLDDVERAVGPLTLRGMLTPMRAAAAGFSVLAVMLLVGGWYALSGAPVGLQWAPLMGEGGALPRSDLQANFPRRAKYDAAADKLRLMEPCFDNQRQPLVVGGEALLLRVRESEGWPLAARLFPPRLMIAAVSRSADPILLEASQLQTGEQEGAFPATSGSVIAVPVEPVEDEVRLFVVAIRERNLKTDDLLAELRQRTQGLTGSALLAAAASFFQSRSAGVIDYQFKVTKRDHLCPS